jgi:adenylate kinase
MLRAAVREGTELGRMAKQVMDAGGLVGDEIMVGIVGAGCNRDDARTRGLHPRRVPAHRRSGGRARPDHRGAAARRRARPRRPAELVLERISARRVCRDCGTNYVATKARSHRGSARSAAGDVMQRDDDTPDAINRRLDLYEEQTAPLIEFYGNAGTPRGGRRRRPPTRSSAGSSRGRRRAPAGMT